MKRRVAIRQYRVPFLPEKRIEDQARLLLDEWAEAHGVISEPPVPVEDILELHLGLEFYLADLQAELGHPDVLGGIWFGERMIKVDQSLDPSVKPHLLGRYRFTLAHEIGHWRLHRQHLMEDPSAQSLFETNCEPAFVQRSSTNPSEEVQANMFASFLLMPGKLVYDAWLQWRGSDESVVISDLEIAEPTGNVQVDQELAMDEFCRPLAEYFEVSAQAMRYRLQNLELLAKKSEPKLF